MDKERKYLRSYLAGESRAYGFTIAFWGSGAVMISRFGVPTFYEALIYGAGGVSGFGLMTLVAFSSTLSRVGDTEQSFLGLSMIHYLAALAPIFLSKLIAETVTTPLTAFFLAGASASVVYNTLSILEEDIAELIS